MASREVQKDYHGGIAEWKTAEGVTTEVSYREDEDEIIADIIGGLRSGLTYIYLFLMLFRLCAWFLRLLHALFFRAASSCCSSRRASASIFWICFAALPGNYRPSAYWFRSAITPPSTFQIAPVIQLASSESKKTIVDATSLGSPIRPIG